MINVSDSGAPDDGVDTLTINGTATADQFLLRREFVALMQTDSSGLPGHFAADYERINYDASINILRVNTANGDDHVFADDNSAITTIDGGAGDDSFQIGQLFGADRIAPQVARATRSRPSTQRLGFLSPGVSYATTVMGGGGDDAFGVDSAQAPLKLFGEDGNDTFIVRAFQIVGTSTVATSPTTVSGGAGDDHIEYNVNAPVGIDGGAGADTVIVLGTEAADNFVIMRDGVIGAGLATSFSAIERLEVDGLSGDDTFFVLSTAAGVVTTLIGDDGSDTFDIGGDVTLPIVARPAVGRTGFINHSVSSADPAFNGIFASGIALAAAESGAVGGVVVTPSGADTTVYENAAAGQHVDTYTLSLSMPAPATATTVYVTVAPTLDPSLSLALGGGSVEVSTDGITYAPSLILTFDSTATGLAPTAWTRDQTIYVRAITDGIAEGPLTTVIDHSTQSTNAAFTGLAAAELDVRVIDADRPDVVVTESGGGTQTLEGGPADTFLVSLTQAPAAGETVSVTLSLDPAKLAIAAAQAGQSSRLVGQTISFTAATWNQPFEVAVSASTTPRPTVSAASRSGLGGERRRRLQRRHVGRDGRGRGLRRRHRWRDRDAERWRDPGFARSSRHLHARADAGADRAGRRLAARRSGDDAQRV